MSISERARANIHPFNQRSKAMAGMSAKSANFTGEFPFQFIEVARGKIKSDASGILEVALNVEVAHEELGPARFLEFVNKELKWSKSSAYKLLNIARDEKLYEAPPNRLPTNWSTLYELSRLTDAQFARGMEIGVIHARMQRKDVQQLRLPSPKRKSNLKHQSMVSDFMRRVMAFLRAVKQMMPARGKMASGNPAKQR